ncbi:MAG: Nramp family divalent metal transporter [Candidatus Omnitrophota bacterium]
MKQTRALALRFRIFFRNLFIFFAVIGPGIITANVDNDAGGIATYSVAGAHFGYTLLWIFIPMIPALIVIQEMCSRMGVVTGKGLADLIREKFGLKVTFYAMAVLVLSNLGNTMAEFSGIAASGEIFGISRFFTVPLAAVFVWWLVVKGTYKSVEKVFLFACLFYIAYIISGFLIKPRWGEVFGAAVSPSFRLDTPYLFMVIGLVGTTIAPWMQFYQQSAVVEKGINVRDYRYARLDVIIGSLIVNVVAFFIVMVCAATLFKSGIRIESAQDAALALKPLAGKYCSYLFAFGLLNASLFAASILPLATAYSVCEGLGWDSGVDKRFKDAPQFYTLYTGLIAIGAGVVMFPKVNLIFVMLVSQFANGLLLPFVLVFMLILINDRNLMGDHVNSKIFNAVAWLTVCVMSVITILLALAYFLRRV